MTYEEAELLRSLFDCLAGYQRSLAEVGAVLSDEQIESLSEQARWDVLMLRGMRDCETADDIYTSAQALLGELTRAGVRQ